MLRSCLRAHICYASHGCCSAIDVVISPACMASSSLALQHLGLVWCMTESGPPLTQDHVELTTSQYITQVGLFSHALHPSDNFVILFKQVLSIKLAGLAKYFKAANTLPCPC